jgi:hypothetical protein
VSLRSTAGEWVLGKTGHKKVGVNYPIDHVRSDPMWLVVVHGGNLHNTFRSDTLPYAAQAAQARFPADFGPGRSSRTEILRKVAHAVRQSARRARLAVRTRRN